MCKNCNTLPSPAEIITRAEAFTRQTVHALHSAADRARAHNDHATATRADELAAQLARIIRRSAAA